MPAQRSVTAERDRSRRLVLLVLCAGMLIVVLDGTAVNVALPVIRSDLGFSGSSLAWVVNAYLVSFGGLLLLAGRLGDLVARRTVFLAGLIVFTAASLVRGLADRQDVLIGARSVQGVGAAMVSAVTLGMIAALFPEPAGRAKVIGVYSFVSTAGGSVGLVAGGALTQALGWHWVFFINLPIGVITVVLGMRWIAREHGPGLIGGADFPGAALITTAMMLAVYAIVARASVSGWSAPSTLAVGGVSATLLVAFAAREATAENPLIPLTIFRSREVFTANVVQLLLTAAMFGMFFLGALYMRRVLNYEALDVGLAFLPMTIVVSVVSLRYAGRLMVRYGIPATLTIGLGLVSVGLALFAQVPVHGHFPRDVLPMMLVVGGGVGLGFPSVMTLAMSNCSETDSGIASGLINTSVQFGGAVGLSVLATLAAGRTRELRAAGELSELVSGYHLAATVAAALVLIAIVATTILRLNPDLRRRT